MARPPLPLDVNDLVKRYKRGETVLQIACSMGVSHTTVQKRLRARGILRKNAEDLRAYKRATMIAVPAVAIVRRYLTGESELALAKAFDTSRTVIRRRLLDAGVDPRGRRAATQLAYDRLTPEQRRAQVARPERLRKCAATRHRRLSALGKWEREIRQAFERAHLRIDPQAISDKYNIDILVEGTVAVEVVRGAGTPYNKPCGRARVVYLLERYALVILRCSGKPELTTDGIQKLVSLCQALSRDPAGTKGQHWMVGGRGELLRASYYTHDIAVIFAAKGGADTGCHDRR